MEAIIAVSVAVLGWLANHVLTIRAQKKSHLSQLRSSALSEIGVAISRYQGWLVKVRSLLLSIELELKYRIKKPDPLDWLTKHKEVKLLVHEDRSQMNWGFLLEEYEILFKKTTEVRKQLIEKHGGLAAQLSKLSSTVVEASVDEARLTQFLEANKALIEEMTWDLYCLTWDLRVYLQNSYLGPLTGVQREVRVPVDDRFPRIIADKKGKPILVSGRTVERSTSGSDLVHE